MENEMFSRTVTAEGRIITIELPEELTNQRLHVEIWKEEGGVATSLPEPDEDALQEVTRFYGSIARDLSELKFDRDEIHER